jgi:hypothetical protein
VHRAIVDENGVVVSASNHQCKLKKDFILTVRVRPKWRVRVCTHHSLAPTAHRVSECNANYLRCSGEQTGYASTVNQAQ